MRVRARVTVRVKFRVRVGYKFRVRVGIRVRIVRGNVSRPGSKYDRASFACA